MSTTLKALQRLEEQRSQRSCQGPMENNAVHLEPVSATGNGSRLDLKAWRWRAKWVTVLLLAIGLTGLWYFFVYDRPGKATPAIEPMSSLDAQPVKIPSGNPPRRQQETPSPDRSITPVSSTPVDATAHSMASTGKSTTSVTPVPRTTPANPWYGDGLKVQAVVYGPDPGTRLAVINGRTVYQGDAVDGFTVVAIEKDAVVVRQGRKLWNAKLGR